MCVPGDTAGPNMARGVNPPGPNELMGEADYRRGQR